MKITKQIVQTAYGLSRRQAVRVLATMSLHPQAPDGQPRATTYTLGEALTFLNVLPHRRHMSA